MSSPSTSGPSGPPGAATSTVSLAGSFPNSANAREGANQSNSYSLNRYVYDAQGSVNDQLARFMIIYEQKPSERR
ncbi:hypothetical protein FGRMN_9877 [Fusarium graminum]|nr:hypothetical protein FGRMN_9877 [Fusarium graminum]